MDIKLLLEKSKRILDVELLLEKWLLLVVGKVEICENKTKSTGN